MNRGIYIAADLHLPEYDTLIRVLANEPGIRGFKVGFLLGLTGTLPAVSHMAHKANPALHVMYDHQKAATDVPFTGEMFAHVMKMSMVDEVILFPLAGPLTQKDWTRYLQKEDITPVLGGAMTHDHLWIEDGGYLDKGSVEHMYRLSAQLGVTQFVMPGNQPDMIKKLIKVVLDNGCPAESLVIMSPGLRTNESIKQASDAVGDHIFYPILGRRIYASDNPLLEVRNIVEMW